MKAPLIVLNFTNEPPSDPKYLRTLSLERGKLEDVLEVAAEKKLCEYKIYSERPLEKILLDLGKKSIRERLTIFHYAGHADSLHVRFKNAEHQTIAVELTKLATVFKDCPQLQLIFLNGCGSIDQAEHFLKEGVPIVIGTDRNIADRIATDFAELFYQQLQQNSIANAFKFTVANFRAQFDAQPEFYYREEVRGQGLHDPNHLPFTIRYREDIKELGRWSLQEAADQPLFGLPDVPKDAIYNWPAVPFMYLKPYDESKARIFHGRGVEISQLYRAILNPVLQSDMIISVSGQSGVGKSSLLQAGLLPRLRSVANVHYFRWQAALPFTEQISTALNCNSRVLLETWLKKEKESGKPLILVVDQIDEIFNGSNSINDSKEWSNLVQMLSLVFSRPGERPKGRILLSYRTEQHQRIVEDLRLVGLSSDNHFIRRLDRTGIIEIVHGLDKNQSEAIATTYRISVEAGLGDDIATFLLRDTRSPIAPVLQIILTRLWENNVAQTERQFSRADFIKLTQQGIWLNDFYRQQIRRLKAKEETYALPVESNGLVLEVLNHHTTERATAKSHTLNEILATYQQHEPVLIRQLISDLDQLSLLAVKNKASILSHDTLGPIIKEAFERSTRPGQNAKRILKSKMIEYQLHSEEAVLEEPALDIVLTGKAGMPAWNEEEKTLIQKSLDKIEAIRLQRRKEKQQGNLRWGAGLISILLISGLLFGLYHLRKEQSYEDDFKAALVQASDDPSMALGAMQQIYLENDLDPSYQNDLYQVYRQYLIYEEVFAYPGSLNKVAISPNGLTFAASTSINNTVYLYQFDQALPIDSFFQASSQISDLVFDDKGCLFVASLDRKGYRWCNMGGSNAVEYRAEDHTYLKKIVPTHYTDLCYSLHNDGRVYSWAKEKGDLLAEMEQDDEAKSITYLNDPASDLEGIWVGTNSGKVFGFLNAMSLKYELNRSRDSEVTALANSRDGQVLLVGTDQGDLEFWHWKGEEWVLSEFVDSERGAVQNILIDPKQDWFAVTYDGGGTSIGALYQEELLYELAGQHNSVHSMGVLTKEDKLVTADEAGSIRAWDIPFKYPIRTDSISLFAVLNLSFSNTQNVTSIDKSGRVTGINLDDSQAKLIMEGNDDLNIPPVFNKEKDQVLIYSTIAKTPKIIDLNSATVQAGERQLPNLGQMALGQNQMALAADSSLYLWEKDYTELWTETVGTTTALTLTTDEDLVVAATAEGTLYWYHIEEAELVGSISLKTSVNMLIPTVDDQVYVLTQNDNPDKNLLLISPTGIIDSLPGEQLLAQTRSNDMYITLINDQLKTFTPGGYELEVFELTVDVKDIECLAISPEGKWIAAGTNRGTVLFWKTSKRPLGLIHSND